MQKKSVIIGTGSYLPERVLTNKELETMVETSDEWITQRSGIRQRRIAAKDETTGTMALQAAKNALDAAGLSGKDIDGVIVATTTPDRTFPSVAVSLQEALDIAPCPAFDIQAVCSGFVYALSVADMFIQQGSASRILVLGAEKMSSIVDWEDRTTCVLFADGAGAVVLEAQDIDVSKPREDQSGVLSSLLYADGRKADILYTKGGTSTTGDSGFIHMEGREVFKHAVKHMADVVEETLQKNNLTGEEIDWLVPHQANIRIIEATAKKLNLPMEKVVVTIDRHGNTSAASIPLALDEAVRDGRIKKDNLLLMEALGAGLTWGSILLRT